MIILIIFAFIAGVVTILSPCILPVLPIILSSTVDTSGKRRPLGVVCGFVLSFTFFTLFLSSLVRVSGIPAEYFRYISVVILVVFGASMFIPQFQTVMEQLLSRFTALAPRGSGKSGFGGGVVIGISLGLLWTPCVGPILASVISLALIGNVTIQAFAITIAYSIGTVIPMFIIMNAGGKALQRVPWLVRNTGRIQKVFGIIMILTAIGIFFNADRYFQSYILRIFPQYGVGLTRFEENDIVNRELQKIQKTPLDMKKIGKTTNDVDKPKGPIAPEIISGGSWLNSSPLTLSQLRGKVVIIDFWTYSCINCQRTFPYLRKWWEKYNERGLVIIGVHAPEFEFEKKEENVSQAIKDFKIPYPVVQDNDFATWRAYSNHYWPAKYFIDKEGHIRYHHFGEGSYDESEKIIQELLSENSAESVSDPVSNEEYQNYARTPEMYLGYGRISNFSSNEEIKSDAIQTYTSPESINSNSVAYRGNWKITEEYANPHKGAELLLNFESKEVFLVMRTKKAGSKVKVFVDGKVEFLGADVQDGEVTINTDRLYKLVNLKNPGKHLLKLQFLDDEIELFAFTFG